MLPITNSRASSSVIRRALYDIMSEVPIPSPEKLYCRKPANATFGCPNIAQG